MARLIARGLSLALAGLTACSAPAQPSSAGPKPAPVQAPPPPAKTGPAPASRADLPPAAKAEPAPVRVAPARPAHFWPFIRLRNEDYVSLRDFAEHFGLKAAWTKSDLTLSLADARGVRFIFDTSQRDFHFDGLRVFLGEPALPHKGSLWISKLDIIKIVVPLFQPADHLAQLPATAPRVIVLDPGHGGIDPGAENRRVGVNEKTFTLDVALRAKKILERQGWRVLMIRAEDRELSRDKKTDLLLRDEFANQNKADLFLSIHFNSAPEAITGVETYTMAPQSMLSTGDDTGDEMTKVAYPGNRLDYANLLFGEQLHRAMLDTLKTPDRGFKRGRRAVLRMLDCPGALVECAYLSNDAEARRVATPEFRQQIAEGVAKGVQRYADLVAAMRPAPAVAPEATKAQ
jgi:N-acetylmuramoyl-L-alanine amidase